MTATVKQETIHGWVAYQVIQQFVANDSHHLKRLSGRNGVHNQVSVDADVKLRVHETVFILFSHTGVYVSQSCTIPQVLVFSFLDNAHQGMVLA